VDVCPTVRRILQAVQWSEGLVFSSDGKTPIGDGSSVISKVPGGTPRFWHPNGTARSVFVLPGGLANAPGESDPSPWPGEEVRARMWAMMVDVLCAVLSGSNWGPFTAPFSLRQAVPKRSVGKGIGHFFGALHIDGFIDPDEFKRQIDDLIRTLRHDQACAGHRRPADSRRPGARGGENPREGRHPSRFRAVQ
jgi:hypothetical protein